MTQILAEAEMRNEALQQMIRDLKSKPENIQPETPTTTDNVTNQAILRLLERTDPDKKMRETASRGGQWNSDRQYVSDNWPEYTISRNDDIIDRVIGLSDFDVRVRNVLATVHDRWMEEWSEMYDSCKKIALERQGTDEEEADLLFPEDPTKAPFETKIRRVFKEILMKKRTIEFFDELNRKEKDSPSKVLWVALRDGLLSTREETMKLEMALNRSWGSLGSTEELESKIRKFDEAVECAGWYPGTRIPTTSEKIVLLDSAIRQMTTPDLELTNNVNVTRKTMRFGHNKSESEKEEFYNELVGEVRRKIARDRHLGKSKDTNPVALTGEVNPQKQQQTSAGKPTDPKPYHQEPERKETVYATPRAKTYAPIQSKGKGKGKGKGDKPETSLCGSLHRHGHCGRMNTCYFKKYHTIQCKPVDSWCLCPGLITTGTCLNPGACRFMHDKKELMDFKSSRTGVAISDLVKKGGPELEMFQQGTYILNNKNGPVGPLRCFKCESMTHTTDNCDVWPAIIECFECKGNHKRKWCREARAWEATCSPKKKQKTSDFHKGRTEA